ncbi:DMT family transporter [Actinomadura sp. HBU206391]|uniref:DMT family transporter n=1 Tax=Actinomadura sp. HBU206391 TaxID=2731692 RepID=UPI00165026CA|nr:DMT family transporter [Actinomadura sp. HBU206391]MBC6456430.1 DMT family transporter [Actinomadura sp. HBU206391]
MVTLLGIGAALGYGVADFLGGAASRRSSALRVLLLSMPVGLVLLLAAAVLTTGAPPSDGMAWGFAGGLAGGTGILTFYRALAQGPMSVVAPVSALAAAILPVAAGALSGERLEGTVLAGVVLCVAAVALVSMEDGGRTEEGASRRTLLDSGPFMAAVSGFAFGGFFIMLNEAGDDGGLWPLVASRTSGFALLLVTALIAGGPKGASLSGTATLVLVAFSGVLDAAGNALYFLAAQQGMLSLAAVLTSLYPAVTVLLARVVYSERLRVIQRAGLAVAVAGVALVTLG